MTAPPPEPTWRPLEGGTDSDQNPEAIQSEPSESGVRAASLGAGSRVSGEEFALAVANLYVDARSALNDTDILNDVGDDQLSDLVTRFIVEDKQVQRQLNTQRHFDPDAAMWLRSTTQGPSSKPEVLSAEIAGRVLAPGLDHSTWFKVRVDVNRRDSAWKVADLSATVGGPDRVARLSESQRRSFLEGTGWRRLR